MELMVDTYGGGVLDKLGRKIIQQNVPSRRDMHFITISKFFAVVFGTMACIHLYAYKIGKYTVCIMQKGRQMGLKNVRSSTEPLIEIKFD